MNADDINNITVKRWGRIFTCPVTQNIHLEVVADLSATAFLSCFRGFISIRGQPRIVYSDNATKFKAASNALAYFGIVYFQMKKFQPIIPITGLNGGI